MKTKTLVIVALAFAAGGTCPSDVNDDGTVGINDFMQVLRDWGECPGAPKVLYVDAFDPIMVRHWSDGVTEVGNAQYGLLWGESPPTEYEGTVVGVTIITESAGGCQNTCHQFAFSIGGFRLFRYYADGHVETMTGRVCAYGTGIACIVFSQSNWSAMAPYGGA